MHSICDAVPTSRKSVSAVRNHVLGDIDSSKAKSWALSVISLMLIGLATWNEDPAMFAVSRCSRFTVGEIVSSRSWRQQMVLKISAP